MKNTHKRVLAILDDVLQLDGRSREWMADAPLLGSIAELDSMAVVSVLTRLEEQFDISIADDEVSAEHFATVGSLWAFVDDKLAHSE